MKLATTFVKIVALINFGSSVAFADDNSSFTSTRSPNDVAIVAEQVACASGGPASEAFYEQEYLRCRDSYCPAKCTSGGNAHGDYYTNGMYAIVCNCY